MTIHIPAGALTDFCAEIFARVGCSSEEARRVSASLVDANLTGHDSHGVIRVPRYPVAPPRPPRSVARREWKMSFPD